jgi:hypothetical protein
MRSDQESGVSGPDTLQKGIMPAAMILDDRTWVEPSDPRCTTRGEVWKVRLGLRHSRAKQTPIVVEVG